MTPTSIHPPPVGRSDGRTPADNEEPRRQKAQRQVEVGAASGPTSPACVCVCACVCVRYVLRPLCVCCLLHVGVCCSC